jgi:hypothetical protein
MRLAERVIAQIKNIVVVVVEVVVAGVAAAITTMYHTINIVTCLK